MSARVLQAGKVLWSLAAGAICVALLTGFARGEAPLTIKLSLVALAAAMAWRPIVGAIATAVLVPSAFALLVLTGASLRLEPFTDAIVIAALAGACVRSVFDRSVTPSRLAGPAWAFGALVAASAIVNIARAGATTSGPEILSALWAHATGPYFTNTNKYLDVHEAVRWIAGVALAVVIERALRRAPSAATPAVRLWLVGGAAAASFAWLRLADVVLRHEDHLATLMFMFRTQRVSTLFPDVNAAGSYFALLLVPAVWLGVARRRWGMLFVVAPIVLLALVLTQSRSALGAVAMVLGGAWVLRDVRAQRFGRVATVAVVVAATTFAVSIWTRDNHGSPARALEIRHEMAKIALKIAREDPVFGAGVGMFRAASRAFVSTDFIAIFPVVAGGENAHNQFLQVLAELGAPALVLFFVLVAGVIARALWRPGSAEHAAVGAGLAAFAITAAFGHPLLIAPVMALFAVALGLGAGLAPAPADRSPRREWMTAALVGAIALTVPFRVAATRDPGPPPTTGVGEVAGQLDGVEYRRVEAHSTWLFSPYARAVELPMRWDAAGGRDCAVTLHLDGEAADTVRLTATDWRRVRFPLPPLSGRVFERRLDLRVEPAGCTLLVGPMTLTR
ncbi:MAG TPA: O-antigen ligase family protein [Vicinamibacterales bacterium]|nr:O-antigen ligase family protein [Vicinamibacterales bacterium]